MAIFLMALILLVVPFGSQNDRRDLETAVDDLDRAVRFASNESVLRNTITRVTIKMDEMPVQYFVEYGPESGVVLPKLNTNAVESRDEIERQTKKLEEVNRQFNRVSEFEESSRELSGNIFVLGVATTYSQDLATAGDAHLYFFPSGERDGALVFFSSGEELATLEVMAFQEKTLADYHPLPSLEGKAMDDKINDKMKELYQSWIQE